MADATEITETGETCNVSIDGMRGRRYAELFLVGPEQITILNSIGLSEAPPELWDSIDPTEAAQQLGRQAIIKNGPHWWASDRLTLTFGVAEVSVGGIGFRVAARIPASVAKSGKLEPPFYTVAEAGKEGSLSYSAGEPVYELVSPECEAFVMQSSNVEPGELAALEERLEPAEGWSFRTRLLDRDLTVPMDGKVRTVMDDLKNVYNFPRPGVSQLGA